MMRLLLLINEHILYQNLYFIYTLKKYQLLLVLKNNVVRFTEQIRFSSVESFVLFQ